MSDADYRIDGLESRVSSCEDDLRSQISSERYETEREIENVESRIRSTDRDVSELERDHAEEVRNLDDKIQELRSQLAGVVKAAELQEEVCAARAQAIHGRIFALSEAAAAAHERIDALSLKCGVTS